MIYNIDLGNRLSVELEIKTRHAALDEADLRLLTAMKKDIGLSEINMENAHAAWHLTLTSDSIDSIQLICGDKSLTDIPFVLVDGTLRFGHMLLIIDDTQTEELAEILIQLSCIAIAYMYWYRTTDVATEKKMLQQIIQTILGNKEQKVAGSLQPNGTWDMNDLRQKAQSIIAQAADEKVIKLEKIKA